MLMSFGWIVGGVSGALLVVAGLLHLVPRLGPPGRAVSARLCRAPALDVVITYFTILPLAAGPWLGARLGTGAWLGLLGGVLGQIAAVLIWTALHEAANPAARRGPRIVKSLNRAVGPLRNHAAVWWTAWAVPIFWMCRVGEVFVYPPLTWIVGLPRYKTGDWVNVSRQKFSGLVGHDLIWCLYCDWMTGVWSLGSEMLRNVESFWCPIRFDSSKKCENCRIDFPDVENGWIPADRTIADVAARIDEMYGPEARARLPRDAKSPWFGHPARLTVKGRPHE